jgi:hypothetical protein
MQTICICASHHIPVRYVTWHCITLHYVTVRYITLQQNATKGNPPLNGRESKTSLESCLCLFRCHVNVLTLPESTHQHRLCGHSHLGFTLLSGNISRLDMLTEAHNCSIYCSLSTLMERSKQKVWTMFFTRVGWGEIYRTIGPTQVLNNKTTNSSLA